MGDGYVHRLLYHKGGDAEDGTGSARGKLVEVADPHTNSDQRPRTAPLSDELEEEMMHRKLESWAQQYTVLLSSGLEDQRQHFEARLQELRVSMCMYEYEHTPLNRLICSHAHTHTQASFPRASMSGEQVVAALKQEKRQLEQRCVVARERLKKVVEERGFLTELNQSLEKNQGALVLQIREAEDELTAREAERQEKVLALQAQVKELMMQLDGNNGGGEEGGDGGEIEGGGGSGKGAEEAKETERKKEEKAG